MSIKNNFIRKHLNTLKTYTLRKIKRTEAEK